MLERNDCRTSFVVFAQILDNLESNTVVTQRSEQSASPLNSALNPFVVALHLARDLGGNVSRVCSNVNYYECMCKIAQLI